MDPGGATGLALYESDPETHRAWVEHEWFSVTRQVADQLTRGLDALVVEDYRIGGPRASSTNATVELIGALRLLAETVDVPLVRQAPGAGQAFAGPGWGKLKRLGWYTPGPDHARSASAHLLLFLVTAGHLDPARLLPEGDHAAS